MNILEENIDWWIFFIIFKWERILETRWIKPFKIDTIDNIRVKFVYITKYNKVKYHGKLNKILYT